VHDVLLVVTAGESPDDGGLGAGYAICAALMTWARRSGRRRASARRRLPLAATDDDTLLMAKSKSKNVTNNIPAGLRRRSPTRRTWCRRRGRSCGRWRAGRRPLLGRGRDLAGGPAVRTTRLPNPRPGWLKVDGGRSPPSHPPHPASGRPLPPAGGPDLARCRRRRLGVAPRRPAVVLAGRAGGDIGRRGRLRRLCGPALGDEAGAGKPGRSSLGGFYAKCDGCRGEVRAARSGPPGAGRRLRAACGSRGSAAVCR